MKKDDDAGPPREMKMLGTSATGLLVAREDGDTIEIGELRPMEHGKPIHGEVVRTELDFVRGVATMRSLVPAPSTPARSGPPKVTNDAYRGGWDAIFGKGATTSGGPNRALN